jgi:hypothetical protein
LRYYIAVMFPTRMKTHISQTQSYPVTAKEISEALADVPQAEVLVIDFFHYQRMKDRGKPYPVLSVNYAFRFVRAFRERDWSVRLSSVPHNLRQTVNCLLKEQALPAMRQWLLERKNLSSSHDKQALTAFFSELDAALRLEHLQTAGESFSM